MKISIIMEIIIHTRENLVEIYINKREDKKHARNFAKYATIAF